MALIALLYRLGSFALQSKLVCGDPLRVAVDVQIDFLLARDDRPRRIRASQWLHQHSNNAPPSQTSTPVQANRPFDQPAAAHAAQPRRDSRFALSLRLH